MSVKFELLQNFDEKWLENAEKIGNVSWRAGQSLADKMKNNHFADWEAVIVGKSPENELMCFCTISKEDGLLDKTITPFIGYVFVSEAYRGNRLSEKLLTYAETYLKQQDFDLVHVVTGEVGLYEKYGYEKIADCKTVHGNSESLYKKVLEK